jgi:hypothetical protein
MDPDLHAKRDRLRWIYVKGLSDFRLIKVIKIQIDEFAGAVIGDIRAIIRVVNESVADRIIEEFCEFTD